LAQKENKGLILVLDDEPTMVEAISRTLQGAGYQVRRATSCEEARRVLEQEKPALLVTDVNMPCMNGFAFVQGLRNDGVINGTRLIFVSAMARDKDRSMGLALGARSYITKPFTTSDLLQRVEHALAN